MIAERENIASVNEKTTTVLEEIESERPTKVWISCRMFTFLTRMKTNDEFHIKQTGRLTKIHYMY